ncbi:MAG: hypothetical protein LBH28_07585 [Oscillospiraceae bacterium]|nr:hypothetical protein [Oscillospiraceae bacterium]
MSVARIKSLVIAALVFLNIIFLEVIVHDAISDASNERQAIENICQVLSGGGIAILPEGIKTAGAISTMRTVRDIETEAAIARVVLGPSEMTDQGVIYRYESSQAGVAEFSSAGGFTIQLNKGVYANAGGALKTARDVLREMKIETSEVYLSFNEGRETAVAVCAYKGSSIFNCTIEFFFNGDSLEAVKGRYATGIEPGDDGKTISAVGTVLLGFLALCKKGEVECSRIDYVEAGYQHYVPGSFGEGVIFPAWLIVADSGRYIIDDATGEIISRKIA